MCQLLPEREKKIKEIKKKSVTKVPDLSNKFPVCWWVSNSISYHFFKIYTIFI